MLERWQRLLARGSSERAKLPGLTAAMVGPAFAFAASALLLAQPASLSAQQNQTVQGSACMARPPSNPDSPTFVIKIPTSEQSAMAARGYAIHPCPVDVGAFEAYRERMCHLANVAPAVVQSQFAQKHNASPRELCDLANAIGTS